MYRAGQDLWLTTASYAFPPLLSHPLPFSPPIPHVSPNAGDILSFGFWYRITFRYFLNSHKRSLLFEVDWYWNTDHHDHVIKTCSGNTQTCIGYCRQDNIEYVKMMVHFKVQHWNNHHEDKPIIPTYCPVQCYYLFPV